jgi:hypothetical protein
MLSQPRRGSDFEAAKIRVAQILGREDLIGSSAQTNGSQNYQRFDATSLLSAAADQRDDTLTGKYLAHRLSVPVTGVFRPSTRAVGLKALGYFDPPPKGSKAKPKLVGSFPCAVFATVSADGRTHAHRIYLAPEGAGKADLGSRPDGHPREPKKSASITEDGSSSGCAVLWGDPSIAPHLLLAEGIETAAAITTAFFAEIIGNEIAVAAAISASGVEAFEPYPATQKVTICADRDEADKP